MLYTVCQDHRPDSFARYGSAGKNRLIMRFQGEQRTLSRAESRSFLFLARAAFPGFRIQMSAGAAGPNALAASASG